jgi:hypothetical protein
MNRKNRTRTTGPELSTIAEAVSRTIDTTIGHRAACVITTRVLLKTAERAGYNGKPQPIHYELHNPAAAQFLMDRINGIEHQPTESLYTIGVGEEDRPDPLLAWNGHLVARFGRTLIDANTPAFDRPQHNMAFPSGDALLIPMDAAHWQAFQSGLEVMVPLGNGCLLVAALMKRNDSHYLTTSDWMDRRSDGTRINTLVDMAWADASATIAA